MKKLKKKKIRKLVNKIDSFFDNQTMTPTQREYANFIADIQFDLKQMILKK